jgi:hypothetical protein
MASFLANLFSSIIPLFLGSVSKFLFYRPTPSDLSFEKAFKLILGKAESLLGRSAGNPSDDFFLLPLNLATQCNISSIIIKKWGTFFSL